MLNLNHIYCISGSPASYGAKQEEYSEGVSLDSRTSEVYSDKPVGVVLTEITDTMCNGLHTETSSSPSIDDNVLNSNVDLNEMQKTEIVEEIVKEILLKSEKMLEEQDRIAAEAGTVSPVIQDEEIVLAVNEVVNNVNEADKEQTEVVQETVENEEPLTDSPKHLEISVVELPKEESETPPKSMELLVVETQRSPEREVIDSDLSEAYLTPTEITEAVEKKEDEESAATENSEETAEVLGEKQEDTKDEENALGCDETDVEPTASSGDNQLNPNSSNVLVENKTIEASEEVPLGDVPIVIENSAVLEDIEPSNAETSSSPENIPTADVSVAGEETSDIPTENVVEEEEEPNEIPASIPTISEICDPINNLDLAADIHNEKNSSVTGDSSPAVASPVKDKEEIKRRVSLPQAGLEGAASQAVPVHRSSPQKRPRSASTSTQVDPNHFGKFPQQSLT